VGPDHGEAESGRDRPFVLSDAGHEPPTAASVNETPDEDGEQENDERCCSSLQRAPDDAGGRVWAGVESHGP
jgi:hypothetical protein